MRYNVYCVMCAPGVFISMKALRGPLAKVKEENPLLFRRFTAECQKLGFPEIIRPCEPLPYMVTH